MSSLPDVIAEASRGVVQISFLNANNERVAGGTGFLARDRLLTNHHVFLGHQIAHSVQLRKNGSNILTLPQATFAASLRSGSMQDSFDYVILDVPELFDGTEHKFILDFPDTRRIGEQIVILGFPFEHNNLTAHTGIVSSFYQSTLTEMIQLDASVNAGNSGGPLIDPRNGAVFGIVTRKATGLTAIFQQLRLTLHNNVQAVQQALGMMSLGGFDPVQAFIAGQNQVMTTLDEIERQANVGIGYAISTRHILDDPQLPSD